MASELLKNRALIQRLKEPAVPVVNFGLGDSAVESLIEPDVLPQPKPDELFEERERIRTDRLSDTLLELEPVLMDESVDFIKREEFAIKGLTDQQLLDLGFSKVNLEPAKRSYQKLAEIFQQADIDDELEYLLEKSKNYPKGKIESTLRNVLQKLPEDEKGLKYIASLLGEDVEFVLDMIDDKKILAATGRDEKRLAKQLEKSERLRKEFGQVEKWMLKNASKYSDPKKFKNATIDRFGKKNAAIKAMTSGGGNFFSNEFNNNILGYKGTSDFAKINKSIGDNIFRTTIYNFNPNVREAITNEFKSILSGGPAQVKAEARNRIKQSKLFKQFGLTDGIRGPISRLIYKEVGEELYKNLSAFRNPRVGTINLIKYLEGVVDPKYKSQFKQARIAMEAAGVNEFKKAKEILGRTDKIMFDHKIPSSFIDAGYADPIEYIKVTPTTEKFNVKIKNKQYDVPVMKLLNKFEKASTPEAKQVIYNTILEKHNNFSKKYGGYLDNVKPELIDGKIKFSSSAAPVTKQTEFVKEFAKSGLQTGELKTKDVSKILTAKDSKNIAKQLASFGFKCSAAEGGACDNPMNYLDDIKKQQIIAQGSGNAAANAAKKLSAGRAIFREVLGPAALGFELAAAVPITYLGYKAGLPPARIISNVTYGLVGDTETARLKQIAVKEGIDTADIQKALDFEEASGAMMNLAREENQFRGPDDEMQFPSTI